MARGKRKQPRALDGDQVEIFENLKASRQWMVDQVGESEDSQLPPVEIRDTLLEAMARRAPTLKYAPLDFYHRLGVDLPKPAALQALDDREAHRLMWHALRLAALLGICVISTDHLTDRQLYAHLIERSLRAKMRIRHALENAEESYFEDLLADYSNETVEHQLRFYRDKHDAETIADFENHLEEQGLPIPETTPRPADRDRFLV